MERKLQTKPDSEIYYQRRTAAEPVFDQHVTRGCDRFLLEGERGQYRAVMILANVQPAEALAGSRTAETERTWSPDEWPGHYFLLLLSVFSCRVVLTTAWLRLHHCTRCSCVV